MTLLISVLHTHTLTHTHTHTQHTHTHIRNTHTQWTKVTPEVLSNLYDMGRENMGSETEAKAEKSLEKKRQLFRIHTCIYCKYKPLPSVTPRDVEILIEMACPSVRVEELFSLARVEGLVQYNESRVSTLIGSPVPKLDFAETNTVLCNKVSMSSIPI